MSHVIAVRQHEYDDFDLAIPVTFPFDSGEIELAIRKMYDVLDYDDFNGLFTATHEDHGDETMYYLYLIPVVGGEN